MAIKDWPAQLRPRERLLSEGANSLSDAELLAIFIGTGIKDKDALTLAREYLQAAGSLSALLAMPQNEFCAMAGLGKAKFALLQAALTIAARYYCDKPEALAAIDSAAIAKRIAKMHLGVLPSEAFGVLFLTAQHTQIRFEILFKGSINQAAVYPREIVKRALALNAAAIILAHNHPSGATNPSEADIALTERVQAAMMTVDIDVLDHIIVGAGEPYSMAEAGLIRTL